MDWLLSTTQEEINISRIDIDDPRFLIPSYESIEPLSRSIRIMGVLNPPLLVNTRDGFVPLFGRRRLKAALNLGFHKLTCRIIQKEISEAEGFIAAFWDNVGHRPPNIAYKSYLVMRLSAFMPRDVLARDYLPALGIGSSGHIISRMMRIGGLDEQILELLATGKIMEKTAALLTEVDTEDRRALLSLFADLNLNANKAAETAANLFDYSIHSGAKLHDLLASESFQFLKDPGLSKQDRTNGLRYTLQALRFPDTIAKEADFNTWRNRWRTENVDVRPVQSFESPGCVIQINVDSRTQAESLLSLLSSAEKRKRSCDSK